MNIEWKPNLDVVCFLKVSYIANNISVENSNCSGGHMDIDPFSFDMNDIELSETPKTSFPRKNYADIQSCSAGVSLTKTLPNKFNSNCEFLDRLEEIGGDLEIEDSSGN